MKHFFCVVSFLTLCFITSVHAEVTVKLFPALAPVQNNPYDSSSFQIWRSNAMQCLGQIPELPELGGNQPTLPSAYNAIVSDVQYTSFVTTSCKSWRAQQNPQNPAVANQMGATLNVCFHVIGDGVQQFRLCDIMFDSQSSDSGGIFNSPPQLITTQYSPGCIGVNWGTDRLRNTSDDIRYESTSSMTCAQQPMVDEVFGIGKAKSFIGSNSQATIDALLGWLCYEAPFSYTSTIRVRHPQTGTVIGTGTNVTNIIRNGCGISGDICPTWAAADGQINVSDLLAIISHWGSTGTADVNVDGSINVTDLLIVISNWGTCG